MNTTTPITNTKTTTKRAAAPSALQAPVVTLKCLRVVNSLSEETTCFSAKVYVDGKLAGDADNRGCGGNTAVHITDPATRERVEAHARSIMPDEDRKYVAEHPHSRLGTEWLIDDLVEKAEQAKEDAKLAKIDAKEKARFGAQGLTTYRLYMGGGRIVWLGCKPDEVEATAKRVADKYKTAATKWEIVP